MAMIRPLCLFLFLLLPLSAWSAPQRIVALAPSAAEFLLALDCGERIAGRSGDGVPELASVPDVGPFHSPALEKILALMPDLCVGVADGTPPALLRRLKHAGVETVSLDIRSFGDMFSELERLGAVLNVPEGAEALARRLKARLESIKKEVRQLPARPSVLFLVQEKPFIAAAQGTFISHLVEKAGGRCAVAAQGNVFYPVLGREELARLSPDIILCSGMESQKGMPPKRLDSAKLPPEFRQSRVYSVDADLFFRPSLRAVDALEQLLPIFY